ncbi:MAG: macro domain-containing protein [Mogibacterium sp.]|nr:macro domain-containing protein [Mogibacterium sp.]
MALQIIRNNIINVEADAIVNTANPAVGVGRGVDQAIYEAAGWDRLLEARRKIGEMSPGEAAWTPAFDLRAKYIIHTVGPAWRGGGFGERETVAKCYSNSLKLAAELGCESIAFPLIATGTYGFPKDEALRIAMSEISRFLLVNEMEVLLVVYDKESFAVSGKLFSDIKTFIEDREVYCYPSFNRMDDDFFGGYEESSIDEDLSRTLRPGELDESLILRNEASIAEEYSSAPLEKAMPIRPKSSASGSLRAAPSYAPSFPTEGASLKDRLKHMDKTFQEYLFMLIDRRGLSDPDVYKRANIDRKHFSKIRSNVDYKPSKKTALALAIALKLSLDETNDLLARAGLALSPSLVFDQIIKYCIETGNYDIYEINCILFEYDQQMLGA